jgi:hypothetical protein
VPSWRFLVVPHIGRSRQRRDACSRIKALVEKEGLATALPMVKYESGNSGQYYLGLAVVCDDRSAPDIESTARRILVSAGISGAQNRQTWPLLDPSTNEQVDHFLRGSLECESFTTPLAYEAPGTSEPPTADDLLDELDLGDLPSAEPKATETEKYCRLLYWCSAVGSGQLGRLEEACHLLGIVDSPWSVLRRLVLLGHLEFDANRGFRWAVIPPTLVATADGKHEVLVGQRSPALIKTLNRDLDGSAQVGAPPRLRTAPIADALAYGAGAQIQAVGCVSRRLSEHLPGIKEWRLCLPSWDESDLARYQIQRYDPHSDRLRDIAPITGQPSAGLYRFSCDEGPRPIMTDAFFDDERGHWVCGDYYGLRVLARSRSTTLRARYSPDALKLALPMADRWPMPYERALVLASGALPRRIQSEPSSTSWWVYEGITAELAARMSTLLGIELEGAV